MDMALLIGPMKLWPSGEYARIFQITESRLGFRLSAVGFDDFARCSTRAILDQDAKSEVTRHQPPILRPVTPNCDPECPGLACFDLIAEQGTHYCRLRIFSSFRLAAATLRRGHKPHLRQLALAARHRLAQCPDLRLKD